jgi:uncharacterized DUF497 family protein
LQPPEPLVYLAYILERDDRIPDPSPRGAEPAPERSSARACRERWPQFEWDEANEEKLLAEHDVSAREAEECFANHNDRRRGRKDFVMLASTDNGRWLFLVYELKAGGVVRVYSARDMNRRERRRYRASKR